MDQKSRVALTVKMSGLPNWFSQMADVTIQLGQDRPCKRTLSLCQWLALHLREANDDTVADKKVCTMSQKDSKAPSLVQEAEIKEE